MGRSRTVFHPAIKLEKGLSYSNLQLWRFDFLKLIIYLIQMFERIEVRKSKNDTKFSIIIKRENQLETLLKNLHSFIDCCLKSGMELLRSISPVVALTTRFVEEAVKVPAEPVMTGIALESFSQ